MYLSIRNDTNYRHTNEKLRGRMRLHGTHTANGVLVWLTSFGPFLWPFFVCNQHTHTHTQTK